MTTIAGSSCPKCGTIEKSGKPSCCGRGGSWFKNCGGAGNTKYRYTWYEGIQTCKRRAQSKVAINQQLNPVQQNDDAASNCTGKDTTKTAIAADKTYTFTSTNMPAP